MIKRILVGLAGTPYTEVAIRQAVQLAKCHEAELTGVTIVDVQRLESIGPAPIGAEEMGIELREHRRRVTSEHVDEVIAAFEKACSEENVPHRVHREEGDAFKLMLSHSRYHDLTVFGLKSIFEYYFENEESANLVGRLVGGGVRPIVAVARELRPVRRVLVAYDGSRGAAKTLRQFIQLRPWPDVTLKIVTFGELDEDPDRLLEGACDYCRAHGLQTEAAHVPGSAKERLLPYTADCEADLIVMGNSRQSFLLRKLFGETCWHAMRKTDRPLFLSQ
jgi:nucleotide-binding universal stress UspA family protein